MKEKIFNKFRDYIVILLLLFVVLIFSALSPNFLKVKNLFNIARQVSMLGIIACCTSFPMIAGGMDLSVGSVLSFAGVFAALLMENLGMDPILAVILVLLTSAFLGLLNGLFAVKLGVEPIIVTLGTMTAYKGVAYLLCDGVAIYGMPESFCILGKGYVGGIVPIPVIILCIVIIITSFILNKTTFGRSVFAIGGNQEAARLAGINVSRNKAALFAISGFGAGLAGLIMCARLSSGVPNSGTGYEFDTVTACVIGGISINGGEGKISSIICGVLVIGVLRNGLTLLSINEFYQNVISGTVLLLAVAFDVLQQRYKMREDKRKVSNPKL